MNYEAFSGEITAAKCGVRARRCAETGVTVIIGGEFCFVIITKKFDNN